MKHKNKFIIFCLASMLMLTSIIVGARLRGFQQSATAQEVVLSHDEIQDVYCVGDSLAIPQTLQIDVDGAQIEVANPKLLTPNGAVHGSGMHVFAKEGEYVLYYYGVKDDCPVSASKKIIVNSYSWGLSKDSKAEYGALTRSASDETVEGIRLNLAEDDAFAFYKKLDITGLKKIDVCKIYPDLRSTFVGEPNVSTVTVKIVDAYNPDVFVEVYLWTDNVNGFYCGAGASNQQLGALTGRGGSTIYNGEKWGFRKSDRYQASGVYGKSCTYHTNCATEPFAKFGGMSFSFDLETYEVHLTNKMGGESIVNDLDSTELYGENVFTGFTANEVYAIVQCYNYKVTSLDIQIEGLLGFYGEELKEIPLQDNNAPIVTLNVDKTDEGGIYLVKGKEYTLPTDVHVSDLTYEGDLAVNVYYNYGTTQQTLEYVKNGKFIPTKSGRYTVEYRATDAYKNVGVCTLDLIVVEGEEGIKFAETKLDKLVLAKENVLPEIVAVGKNKPVSTTVSITNPKGERKVLEDTLSYVPIYKGTYKIEYVFQDNVYTRVFTYEITATSDGVFMHKESPKLPAYFIKGATYLFEDYNVFVLGEDGLEKRKTQTQMSVDGAPFEIVDMTKTYKVSGNEKISFKFVYEDETVLTQEREIVDVKYDTKVRDYKAYFQGNYSLAEVASTSFVYTFGASESTGEMKYVTPVSFANLKVNFTVPESKDNFTKLSFILTDYSSNSNQLIVSFEKKDGEIDYTVRQISDGEIVVDQTETLNGGMATTRSVTYITGSLMTDSAKLVPIQPFKNDLGILTVKLENITNESVVEIRELNNQKFGRIYREQAPMLAYTLPSRGYYTNEVYDIFAASISSIANIALTSNIRLTVTAPNGETVKSTDGVLLGNVSAYRDYKIVLEQPGVYHFAYTYSCDSNTGALEETTPVVLNVIDTNAPVVAFTGLTSESLIKMKVGHTHAIRPYTIQDNDTALEDLWLQVSIYDNVGTLLTFGETKYTFTKAGYYTVRIWCMDAYGNVGTAYYNILVE